MGALHPAALAPVNAPSAALVWSGDMNKCRAGFEIPDEGPCKYCGATDQQECQAGSYVELALRFDREKEQRDELLAALESMVSATCGPDGFAECVRRDSGFAYPWPALDEAEKHARTAIANVRGWS